MRRIFLFNTLILLLLNPGFLHAQSEKFGGSANSKYYKIDNAFYLQDDSSTVLKNWTDQGLNVLFKPVKDSLIISINIGGTDKVFFMGMAVTMDNPGFITTSTEAEFYHWMFVSHIKEGIRNAYILKEYVEGSLEKLGKKTYFINIAFADQTELQFYGYELNSEIPVQK